MPPINTVIAKPSVSLPATNTIFTRPIGPLSTTEIIVTNAAELTNAIKGVKGGETILLAPGDYGNFAFAKAAPSLVTIKSLDPNNDAVFHSLKLTRAENFRIEDVDVRNVQDAGFQDKAIFINASNNISLFGVDVTGSLDGNASNDGYGAYIGYSKNISVLNSTFSQVHIGVVAGVVDNLKVAGNDISEAREGVVVSSINGGLFDRNYLHDMQAKPGDHADFFQVHNGGAAVSSNNLTFTNNVMIQGAGGRDIQGIFIFNEKGAQGARHTNIVVENNFYEGAALNAVSVSYVNNATVRDNTVLYSGNSVFNLMPAVYVNHVTNGVVADNIGSIILERGGTSNIGVTWTNNVDVWDPKFKKGIALSDVFAPPPASGEINFSNLEARANGAAAGLGFHSVEGIGHMGSGSIASLAAHVPYQDGLWALHI